MVAKSRLCKISCFWKSGQQKPGGLHFTVTVKKHAGYGADVCLHIRLADTNSPFRATVCPKFSNKLRINESERKCLIESWQMTGARGLEKVKGGMSE